jgi:PPE-repeat protein
MANSSNFYAAANSWTSEQHQAAAAAFGFSARVLIDTIRADYEGDDHGRGMNTATETTVAHLARQAAHHARLAEDEDERMARVLMAQVSYGHGPALTDEEIERANQAHCRACNSIPCRCEGGN